jgi:putative ABC transport system permease protein
MLRDLRYALRILARNPSFTLIAVLAIALGIGANTALYSVVSAVILRPLPFAEPTALSWYGKPARPRQLHQRLERHFRLAPATRSSTP